MFHGVSCIISGFVTVFYFPICPTQPIPEEFTFIFSFTGFLFYFFYSHITVVSWLLQSFRQLETPGSSKGQESVGGMAGKGEGSVQHPQLFICMMPLCSPRAELRWYCKHLKTEFCTGIKALWSKTGSSSAVTRVMWVCSIHHVCWPSLCTALW